MARSSTLPFAALCLLPFASLACGLEAPPDERSEDEAPGPASEETPAAEPARGDPQAHSIYVPAYSHLGSQRDRSVLFAITLSVRNVDPTSTVTLTQVDYFDTSGHRVRRYLRRPRELRPLETAEFEVDTFDEVGGSGANFLVHWRGPSDGHALLTEAVMLGHVGTGYVAFSSRGVEARRPPVLAPSNEPAPAPGVEAPSVVAPSVEAPGVEPPSVEPPAP